MSHRILELYSGIGGMHCAWKESELEGEIVMAIDVNNVANAVYRHNFPSTHLINKNVQSLTSKDVERLKINTILMSPPCQPFSRNGKYLDDSDPRTNSFLYLINLLSQLKSIQYILLENVKGFECSTVRNLFIEKLKECNFSYQEFLLCPSQFGVPNSRLRYYCIARRTELEWRFKKEEKIITQLSNDYGTPTPLENIMEKNVSDSYIVDSKFLKWAKVMDICYKHSQRSCCFTKAYSHYVEGTGSVYTDCSPEEVQECLKSANTFDIKSDEFIETVKKIRLRFFTPKEILSIMMFPKNYGFPEDITRKQCYRLLGNSVNVKVISELLKILFN